MLRHLGRAIPIFSAQSLVSQVLAAASIERNQGCVDGYQKSCFGLADGRLSVVFMVYCGSSLGAIGSTAPGTASTSEQCWLNSWSWLTMRGFKSGLFTLHRLPDPYQKRKKDEILARLP